MRFALAALVLTALIASFSTTSPDFHGIYRNGELLLTIPYQAQHSGSGTLVAEIIDPEDEVLGRSEQKLAAQLGDGTWNLNVRMTDPLPYEDLLWERVRYRFRYAGESSAAFAQTRAISEILRRPVLRVIGQASYLSGAPAVIRVIVSDADGKAIKGGGRIKVESDSNTLFEGRLNSHGTTEAEIQFPDSLSGERQLHFVADTELGTVETTETARFESKSSTLLTTEKRMYQPGQTIHVRSLTLDRANHHAVSNNPLTFEILDPKGNKVFRKIASTDEFGVASTEFVLADEVNLGRYQLHALMGDKNSAELSFTVDRYVLPKFKVAIDFSDVNGKPKRDYRPGDHVTGSVHANYFFGKPVDVSDVTIKAISRDVVEAEAASIKGRTDKEGSYHFDLRLPDFFAGRGQIAGAAPVLVEASVTDNSGHPETHDEPITVTESPLLVTAVPESGLLVPNLENQVFILVSYPDGSPAIAQLNVHIPGASDQNAKTDAQGVATIKVIPTATSVSLKVKAVDGQNNRVSTTIPLWTRAGTDQVLLRPDRAVYKVGDRVRLSVFSTSDSGAAYVDVVKDGQTVLTRDLDISQGRAVLNLDAGPELAGMLDLNVYRIGHDARTIGDHRLVFVRPASELHVQAIADAPVYKPGAEAKIQFHVANDHGQGVRAALGLQVVDEAVFALAEQQPGFAKTFFYLEQELLKPTYEIHSLSFADVTDSRDDGAAALLLSATDTLKPNKLDSTIGLQPPQQTANEYHERYQQALERLVANHLHDNPKDPWGTPVKVQRQRWAYVVTSAGPDRQFGTPDDLTFAANGEVESHLPELKIVRDNNSRSALARIHGTVVDPSGAAASHAAITLHSRTKHFEATTKADGKFDLQNVPPGDYELSISLPGFQVASRWMTLQSHDVATIDATLYVGSVAQAVDVMAAPVFERRALAAGMRMADKAEFVPLPQAPPSAQPATGETHVRSYFPEALYINPKIITDRHGQASISIPMADSITNWRMAMIASTTAGALGSADSAIKVFQDFFVDLDLPVRITQGDCVTIPVAIYNYAGQGGEVSLSLEKNDWFALNDAAEKTVKVGSGHVGSASFTLQANRIGRYQLKLSAHMLGSADRRDIVVRDIEVAPNGKEQNIVFNGRLDSDAHHEVHFPDAAIPEASKIFIRLYPGPLSQVIEGMDAILRLPGGCFEQTSSSTYPNVLALDYMKKTKKLTPEIHAKAESYIATGYQRLLTFEVPGGGFSWFGNAPANKILTAYGLMEFSDMGKVYDVDPKVVNRTREWLISSQQPDGSWKPDTSFINEGATNRFNSDLVRITAYIAWALENTGYHGDATERAHQYVADHFRADLDSYTLAVVANFSVEYADKQHEDAFAQRAVEALLHARIEKGDQAYWTAEETSVYARGDSASVETTALATQALLKWRQSRDVAQKSLAYITSKKDSSGTWGTTQATIMALRAMLMASQNTAPVSGTVQVKVNDKVVETLALTAGNNDLFHQVVIKYADLMQTNRIELQFQGSGSLAYQVAGSYFVPWDEATKGEPLSINVAYDRTKLAQNDIVKATATIKNNLAQTANMVMVDLGIPPGFDLLTEDLDDFKTYSAGLRTGRLEKFSTTPTQAILYFNALAARSTIDVHFRLRAKFPIRAHTFESKIYEYYDPSVSAVSRPKHLEITAR